MKKSAWVVCFCDNELLLLKRSKKSNHPGEWNFPGGTVDEGELAKESALRELVEEAGIRVSESKLRFFKRFSTDNKDMFFYYIDFKKKPVVTINKESSKYKWISFDDFPKNLHFPTKVFYKKRNKFNKKIGETAALKEVVKRILQR